MHLKTPYLKPLLLADELIEKVKGRDYIYFKNYVTDRKQLKERCYSVGSPTVSRKKGRHSLHSLKGKYAHKYSKYSKSLELKSKTELYF